MIEAICASTECWTATGSMLSGWGALAGAAAVAFAAHKASDTFKSYRRQKQEDRRIDTAERILTVAYSFSRTLAAVRSPMSSGGENFDARSQLEEGEWFRGLPESKQRKAVVGQVALRRLQASNPEWDKLFELMPVSRALFGEQMEERLQELWQCVVSVRVSAEMYRDDDGHDPDFTRKMERDFWGTGGDRDTISRDVQSTITKLEGALLPIIRADHDESMIK